MNWCRIGHRIGFDLDEKSLSSHAKWLFVVAIAFSSRHETDGILKKSAEQRALLAEANVPKTAWKELVSAGLLVPIGDGWEIKNFLKYQSSSEHIEAKRASQRQRQREYEARRRAKDPDATSDASGSRQMTDKKNVTDDPREEQRREEKRRASALVQNHGPGNASCPAPAPALPSGLQDRGFPDLWRRWLEHLEALGKPWGKPLQTSKLAELEPLGPDAAGEAIREALSKGWVSLHPDRPRPRNTLEPGESPRRFTTVAEARALLGE